METNNRKILEIRVIAKSQTDLAAKEEVDELVVAVDATDKQAMELVVAVDATDNACSTRRESRLDHIRDLYTIVCKVFQISNAMIGIYSDWGFSSIAHCPPA